LNNIRTNDDADDALRFSIHYKATMTLRTEQTYSSRGDDDGSHL
jgi:hypothetical protein